MRTLYEILAGQFPYDPEYKTNEEISVQVYKGNHPSRPKYGVNDALWALMLQAWDAPALRPTLEEIFDFFQGGEHKPCRTHGGSAPLTV